MGTVGLGQLRELARLSSPLLVVSLTAGGTATITVPSDRIYIVENLTILSAAGDNEDGAHAGYLVSGDGGTTFKRSGRAVLAGAGVAAATGVLALNENDPFILEPGDQLAYSELNVVTALSVSYRVMDLSVATTNGYFRSA